MGLIKLLGKTVVGIAAAGAAVVDHIKEKE